MKLLACFGLGMVLFVGCLLVVVVEAAGGHGTYRAARIVFPTAMVVATTSSVLLPLGYLAAIVQWPVYLWLVMGRSDGRLKRAAAIGTVHLAIAALAFQVGTNVAPIK